MAPFSSFAAIIGPQCQLSSPCITLIMLQVFCSKCSDLRHPVPWEEGRKARICRSCHTVLTSQASSPTIQELPVRPKGLLEVRDAWLIQSSVYSYVCVCSSLVCFAHFVN